MEKLSTAVPEQSPEREIAKPEEPAVEVATGENAMEILTLKDEQAEAEDVPREYSTEVEANSKSETSFGSTPAASIREEAEIPETQLPNASEVPTPKADTVTVEETCATDIDTVQQTIDVSVLTYFPKPPSIHSYNDEVNCSDEKEEDFKNYPVQVPAPVVKEPQKLLQANNSQTVGGAPTSSDSGISMQEDVKDQEVQPMGGSENFEITSLPPVATPIAQEPATVDDAEIEDGKAQVADTVPDPYPEMITHFLETVPEDTLLEPAATVAEDVHVVSTESPKSHEETTRLSERPPMPTIASAPPERMPLQRDFFPDPEADEEKGPETPRKFDVSDFSDALSRPRTRPRTSTLPGRRYSTALTLEIDLKAHNDPDEEDSPTDSPPKSASGDWRPYTLHHRQPSAGFVGLPDQRRLHSVGLRSAVLPYRWQQMRREQALLEGRPGTSHSEA
uniref:WGS project CBMI000000000 data, contig CS3069_c002977 n=1 Tax=Fusarium clavum TaxID=2594811 RepID=A0A090MD82_9HYPO|nr:unnamed protein product [Fusarium clavum]